MPYLMPKFFIIIGIAAETATSRVVKMDWTTLDIAMKNSKEITYAILDSPALLSRISEGILSKEEMVKSEL